MSFASTVGICEGCISALGKVALLELESGEEASSSHSLLGDFGDFELLEIIGSGAMGVVYKAKQRSLKRHVALKMIRRSDTESPDVAHRFQVEAEAAATLHHPNIVPIYEVGEAEGEFFYAMQWIDGENLAQVLEQRSLAERESAALVAAIARAMHYAHQCGVLHRDLKPGNILIDQTGKPYVSDFGLARFLDQDSSLTLTSAALGSPAYMAPEQASGEGRTLTTAVDVYGLGAILYHLLTGRPPFAAASMVEMIRKVSESDPVRPSTVTTTRISADLETICLRCLEKTPGHRYASAEALAEDLERWQAGEPIRARPSTGLERLTKWVRRKPAIASLAVALLVAVITGLVGVSWQSHIATIKAREADARHYASTAALVDAAFKRQDYRDAHTRLLEMQPTSGRRDLRGIEWALLSRMGASDALATIGTMAQAEHELKHEAQLWFTSEDQIVVMGGTVKDSCLRQFDRSTRQATDILPSNAAMWFRASYAPGARLALGTVREGEDIVPQLIAVDQPDQIRRLPLPKNRLATRWLHLCETGDRAVIVLRTLRDAEPEMHYYRLWSLTDEPRLMNFEIPSPYAGYYGHRETLFSKSGTWLAAGEPEGTVRVWKVDALAPNQTRPAIESLDNEKHRTTALSFSQDERLFACARGRGEVEVWEMATCRRLHKIPDTPNALREPRFVSKVAFSPNGDQLAVCRGQAVQLWKLSPGVANATPIELFGHRGTVTGITYTPDGKEIVTTGSDGEIKVFPAVAADPHKRQIGARFPAARWECGSFSSDGRRYVFVDDQGVVSLVDVTTLSVVARLEELGNAHTQAMFLHGLNRIAVGTEEGFVKIIDAGTLELTHPPIQAVEDGKPIVPWRYLDRHDLLVLSGFGRIGVLIDARSWQKIETDAPLRHSTFWAVSHDQRFAFNAQDDLSLGVYPIDRTGAFLFATHAKQQTAATAGPLVDGRSLAIAYTEKGSAFWDVTNPNKPAQIRLGVRMEFAAEFSPDGKRLATYADGVTLWDVETALPMLRLPTSGAVSRIRFSPSGNALAVGCGGKLVNRYWVHLWRAE